MRNYVALTMTVATVFFMSMGTVNAQQPLGAPFKFQTPLIKKPVVNRPVIKKPRQIVGSTTCDMTGTWKTDKRVTWTFVPTNKRKGLYTAKSRGRTGTAVFDKGKLRIFYKHSATKKGDRFGFYDLVFKTSCVRAKGKWSDSFGLKGFASLNFLSRNTSSGKKQTFSTAPIRNSTVSSVAASKKGLRYRVTVTGFKVKFTERDNRPGGDGAGNEVFVEAIIYKLKRNGSVTRLTPVRSLIMGSIKKYRNRVKAGTASRHGGLKSGDSFPRDLDKYGNALFQPGQKKVPPMVIFEGNLALKDEAIIIMPTIWEWDKNKKNTAKLAWEQWNKKYLPDYMKMYPEKFLDGVIGHWVNKFRAVKIALKLFPADRLKLLPLEFRGMHQTRPIGTITNKKADPRFMPLMIIINEHSRQRSGVLVVGIYQFSYEDRTPSKRSRRAKPDAQYNLFVNVERL